MQDFTTHSFTNSMLYPCLNYFLPQTFHSLNFRINIKRNAQPFSIECSLLENGENSNLTYLLHYTKQGWRKQLGRIQGCRVAVKYFSPKSTQGKNFVYEFCVLFTRHKIHKQNFCLVYSWVKNTLNPSGNPQNPLVVKTENFNLTYRPLFLVSCGFPDVATLTVHPLGLTLFFGFELGFR